MEVKTYTIDEIKNIVTPIAEKYQIAQVYLFGSFARGDLYGSVGCIRTKSRCTDYRKSVRWISGEYKEGWGDAICRAVEI